ncbi:hypothetical protein LNKW23_41240 [Paralimibaculum aggregatum]|uniref:ABC-type transport auxiliary lipoprotein component domain-containing protein n=1 Tax=Paralimibaculum aggregatum TaxID=3036245 RepID=A0ABQ6LS23_9RHOB|nr:hypothetical protein [Limibaculum sp. NKW23]GMG84908.1 hypothetical protein LNKW23_41240 [Limibaculum sp. NKW23]
MRFGLSSLFAAAALAGLAACANQYDLGTADTAVPRTSGPVAITVIERRDSVLAGRKPPSFVGLQSLGVGEPLDVTTSSGQPLADDMAELLAAAFYRQQTETWVVRSSFGDTAADAFRAFLASPSDRLLLIEIREWQTDTLISVSATWDLVARVYDRDGTVLAEERERGSREWEETVILDEQKGRIAADHLSALLGALLGRRSIAAALAS